MKKFTSVLLALLLLLSMAACGNKSAEPAPASSGSTESQTAPSSTETKTEEKKTEAKKTDFVIAMSAEPISLDPQDNWNANSLPVMKQMFNGLVKYNDNMEIVGDLAESWEFSNDTTVTFKLKKGVLFHNGEEMKAEDVVYSIERAMNSAKVKAFTANIESVEANDEYTVTIKTSVPYAPLMGNLCHSANYIISKKAAEEMGDKFIDSPVGTGPFKFVSWTSGDKIILERHDQYFANEVLPTSLTFKLIKEAAARTIALETGEVDVVMALGASDLTRVEESSVMTLVTSVCPKNEYLAMNETVEPFNDVRVRQAINYVIDRESLNIVATGGISVIDDSCMSSAIKGHTTEVTHYEYNVEKAKELLAAAGYPNGFSTSVVVGNELRNTEATLIQDNLKQIGIEVEIILQDSATSLETINRGDHEMFIQSYNNTTGDPDTSLYMLFKSDVPPSSGNRAFYNNARVDELLEAGRLEINWDKRAEMYKEIQQILADDAVWVPLYDIVNAAGIRSDLQGFTTHPLLYVAYDNLHY